MKYLDWLIDWLYKVLRRIGNISAHITAATINKLVSFVKFALAALTSLLFIEMQWNGLLRAKGVVILDTGYHLTSHPTDI